jgi:hypothetical protein
VLTPASHLQDGAFKVKAAGLARVFGVTYEFRLGLYESLKLLGE